MITNEGFKGGTTCVAQPIKYLTEDNVKNLMRPFGSKGKIVSKTEKSPTLLTQTGGGNGVYLAEDITDVLRVKEATKLGYTEISRGGCVDLSMSNSKTRRGRNMAEKSNCLQTTCDFYQYCGSLKNPVYQVKDGMIDVKGKKYPIKLLDGCYAIRKLTVRECMRLQTVPEWYDFSCVSNSQAYKMLGNGWTIEVIAHLIKSMLASVEEIPFYEENHQFTLDEFLTMN